MDFLYSKTNLVRSTTTLKPHPKELTEIMQRVIVNYTSSSRGRGLTYFNRDSGTWQFQCNTNVRSEQESTVKEGGHKKQ